MTLSGRSMYSRKRVGSRIETWRTPELIYHFYKYFLYCTTGSCLLLINETISWKTWKRIPQKLCRRLEYQTLSNLSYSMCYSFKIVENVRKAFIKHVLQLQNSRKCQKSFHKACATTSKFSKMSEVPYPQSRIRSQTKRPETIFEIKKDHTFPRW